MQWDYLLNYPLERVKTKCMSNPKNMPFLMCPTRRTGALGGTPLTRSEAGGHIKKGAWVSAHDAALVGLADLLVSPVDLSTASQAAKQQDHEPDGEEGVEHGSLLQRQAEQANAGQHDTERSNDPLVIEVAENGQSCAEEGYEDGEKAGHSGLGFLLGGALGFGPTKIAARDLAGNACQFLEARCVLLGDIGVLLPCVDRLSRDMELSC
jgi:hypothetical protein